MWDPSLYLQFGGERTQPCLDLVGRITITPKVVADLGCGPGNSTAVLRARWPEARVTGIDASPDMLDRARTTDPAVDWVGADIADWQPPVAPDLIFTNAALQWVPNHAALLPRLMGCLAPSGVLAIQIPYHLHSAAHRIIERLCVDPRWAEWLDPPPAPFEILNPDDYYRQLAPITKRIEIWQTTYWHILENPPAIVQWMSGTGLRPYLERLPADRRQGLLAAYEEEVALAYPAQPDGHALFPFERLFLLAESGLAS